MRQSFSEVFVHSLKNSNKNFCDIGSDIVHEGFQRSRVGAVNFGFELYPHKKKIARDQIRRVRWSFEISSLRNKATGELCSQEIHYNSCDVNYGPLLLKPDVFHLKLIQFRQAKIMDYGHETS